MMQHTGNFSFYKQKVSLEKLLATDYGKAIVSDSAMNGAEVHLVIIPRLNEVPFEKSQDVKRFWTDFMRKMNVSSVSVRVLP
jgi:hypothetical protein